MNNTEYIKSIKDYKEEITSSVESSKKFLIDLGLLTKKGNVKSRYKKLCIKINRH